MHAATAMSVDFPDEVLDLFFAALGDSSWDYPSDESQVERQKIKSAYLECSRVCKRWNNIVLPHLFRSVRIVLPGKALSSRIQFLSHAPQIAKHVQALHLDGYYTLGTLAASMMDDLLRALPSLRCLDLYCVFLQGAVLNSTTPRVIEKLRFKDSENEYDPVGQCASIVTLVALFTEIGELDIDVGDATWVEEETEDLWFVEKYVDVVTANGTVGHTRIRELRCGGKAISRIFVPLYLLKIGALENLTHLTVHLPFDTKWTEFFKLVLAASSTLTTMCIEFGDFTGFDPSFDLFPDTSPTQDVTGMEHALSKCTLLEDIKIVTPLLFCRWYDEHRTDWLSPIHTLTFIPTTQLRRVTLDIQGTSDNAHDLAWDQLRNWLSGLTHLEEVNIELKQAFDQRICLASEMGQYRSVFTPRYILPNGDTIVDSLELPDPYQVARTYEYCDSHRQFLLEQNA